MLQGAVLGPLIFNIFINDVFYFIQEASIRNVADDNSLYSIGDNFKEIKIISKKNFGLLQVWFYENHTLQNLGKCHYLIINKDITNESIDFGKKTLHAENEQKLLGLIIGINLIFQGHGFD